MAHGTFHFEMLAPRSKLYQRAFESICSDLPDWSSTGVSEDQLDAFFLNEAVTERYKADKKISTQKYRGSEYSRS